ncbi:hypothetical protein Gogos_015397 [Gossypium gossypioides]|uniref:Uncharacterized protein n=1 Tax=Gossypium gossypioides TaxID=34282 RepID=A0A7J9C1K4_GOSGO|nr:hypothetical protein [Gossypium gossypioides]
MRNIEAEKLQEILEELTVSSSKWTMSKHGSHICRRDNIL